MKKINKKQNNKDLFNSIIIQMEKLRDLNLENLSKSLKDEKEQNIKTLINTFLQNGGDINARLSNNTHNQNATMLHVACLYGLTSIVQFLIDNGADINLCNKSGETPLDIAKKYGRQTIETYLIQKGAKYNKYNKHDFIEK